MIENKIISPFKRFCVTIGLIPSSFAESMTYYECLNFLSNYINNNLIPATNNNSEAITELQTAFIELKNYVDNLDLTEEVNAKLDEMATDGTLASLINPYIEQTKLDYYLITDETNDEVQALFQIDRPKVIAFGNDYTFTSTMRLNKNTTILLNNHNITFDIPSIVEDNTKSQGFYNFLDNDEFLDYDGNGNITIKGGTITGGNASFIHARDITFSNINFTKCQCDHILEMCAIKNLVVDSCTFDGTPYNSGANKENIQFDNCIYNFFPHFTDENNPTYDGTMCKDILIKNCTFKVPVNQNYHFTKGIGMHDARSGQFTENITIEGCTFTDMKNMGIELFNTKNVIIKNNTFSKTGTTQNFYGAMIRFRGNSNTDILIENNYFTGNYYCIDMAGGSTVQTNFTIKGNTFENYNLGTTYNIVHLKAPRNCKLESNIFKNFNQIAVRSDQSTDTDYANMSTLIVNNVFKPEQNITENIMKLYCGIAYVYTNSFITDNYTTPTLVRTSDSTTVPAFYFKGNTFDQKVITAYHEVQDECANPFYNVYGCRKQFWTGPNTTFTLTNQTGLNNLNIFNFNTMEVTLGAGGYSQTIKLRCFNQTDKLDTRTWKFYGVNSSGVGGWVSITVNVDGTFNYSSTNSDIPLRNIYVSNE